MINQEAALATSLQAAFTNGDTATATSLLGQMAALKTEGHNKYNP
jgi:hypothetical protein